MNRTALVAALALSVAGCTGESSELRAVRAALKDPDSAQFQDVRTVAGPDGVKRTCGRVNAKNAFGGYTGPKPFAVQGTQVVLESADPLVAAMQQKAFETCTTLPATTISDEDRKDLEAILKS